MSAASPRTANWADVALRGMGMLAWACVNVLAAMGVMALVAVAVGSFTFDGTMLQLSNLADRYVAADAGRRHQFDTIVVVGFAISFFAISFFRRGALRAMVSNSER